MHHSRIFGGERTMHRKNVGCGEDTVDILRVPARMDDLHPESFPYFLHPSSDPPVTDDTDGFPREFDLIRFPERNMRLSAPAPAPNRVIVMTDAVRKLEDESEGELCDRIGPVFRYVGNGDATGFCGGKIYVVVPRGGGGDEFQ